MHYRDDQAALEARREDLRQELADLGARAAELRAAEQSRAAIERELAAVEARLAQSEARRASLLENVRVASPCTASWEAMTGDDRVRFCGQCQKNVYNLSAMAREEAEALLAAREGSLCVRLYRRADGTVLTSDCSVGARKKRVRLAVVSALGAGALASGVACYARSATRPVAMMGAVATTLPDTFVDMPLGEPPTPDVVFVYWREAQPGVAPRQQWTVYADGHVMHEIDGALAPIALHRDAVDLVVRTVLTKALELRPGATGVVRAYADSAAYAGFELYGAGAHALSDRDRREIVEAAETLVTLSAR